MFRHPFLADATAAAVAAPKAARDVRKVRNAFFDGARR